MQRKDFAVFGSMIEASECLTRLIGQYNSMLWMGEYPARMGAVINRIGAHFLECAKAEIDAGEGLVDGSLIWGDVAYKKSTFMSPDYWRKYFKPWVAQMADYAHGLPVIYHGCGNVSAIFQDYIEIGIDGYNPLEAKAGWTSSSCDADLAIAWRFAATATCSSGKVATAKPSVMKYCASSTRRGEPGSSSNPITRLLAPCPVTPMTTL
jgi:uroporphyrinogen-III decarboxylase